MDTAEFLSALGFPARLAARTLILPRYLLVGCSPLLTWPRNTYARARYGKGFVWRLWLLFDLQELEVLERLINEGSDSEILTMREGKLEQFKLVALVGALLATLALQALNLPYITETTFIARASFTVSVLLSLLATFFTCIQQRELGIIKSAPSLRLWFSNGIRYTNAHGCLVYQSSLTSLTLMEAPYEYISLAVANFVAGMAAYLWSSWSRGLAVQYETSWATGMAVLVYFAVGTGFAFSMFPVLLGSKDREIAATGCALDGLGQRGDVEKAGEVVRWGGEWKRDTSESRGRRWSGGCRASSEERTEV